MRKSFSFLLVSLMKTQDISSGFSTVSEHILRRRLCCILFINVHSSILSYSTFFKSFVTVHFIYVMLLSTRHTQTWWTMFCLSWYLKFLLCCKFLFWFPLWTGKAARCTSVRRRSCCFKENTQSSRVGKDFCTKRVLH